MSNQLVEIIDAVAREKMVIERYGGDVFLKIYRNDGKLLHVFGIQMKRNDPRIFKKIEELFDSLKDYVLERPGDFYGNSELAEKKSW